MKKLTLPLTKGMLRQLIIPLILVIIPLTVLSFITINQFQVSAERSTIANMQSSVEERVTNLRNSIDAAKREGYGLTQNPLASILVNYSNQIAEGNLQQYSGQEIEAMKNSLEIYITTLVNESQFYENIFFLDKYGNFVLDALDGAYSKLDFKKMDFFSSALRGNKLVQDVTTSSVTKRPIVIIGNPMYDDNHQMIGVSGTVIQFDVLSNRAIRKSNNSEVQFGIANMDGLVMGYTGQDLVISKHFADINQSLKKMNEYMVQNHIGHSFYEINGTEQLIVYSILPEKGWHVFSTIDVNEYEEGITNIKIVNVMILVVCIVIALLVIIKTRQLKDSNTQYAKAIDELKATQRQLIISEKMAALGGLVAGMAHEINTPVGIGVTAVTHLKEKTDEINQAYLANAIKKSDLEKFIEVSNEATELIYSNLNRASNLIQSFKLIAVDQSTDEKRLFNVGEYMGEIIRSLDPILRKTKHQINIECNESISLYSYPGVVSQIISNLVINSVRHAYDEGVGGSITISVKRNEDKIILNYKDDGKGVPEDIIDKIFDPFFTTKRNQGGTGLGLNIVYNLVVNELQGSINCNSKVGVGTEFTIVLPYERVK